MPATGDWIVGVWRTGAAPTYGIGNVRQMSYTTCDDTPVQELESSLSLSSMAAGGGVFDLDGGLLAVILPCRERLVAVATTSIATILQRGTSPEQQLEARYGLSVGPMSSEAREHFKSTAGLLVRTVWIDHVADKAGIWPGDIVTALNGQAVTTVADLVARLAGADASGDVTVRRGRRRLTITLVATGDAPPAPGTAAGAGLVLEQPAPTTYPIKSVLPGSRAAAAGLKAGDRLIRIDQAEPRTVAQVERVINADPPRPAWLELIRDGRRLGLLLR
jgi:serine protease DegQ